jgi:L-ornithine Nalpha-acyltransferase
MKLDVSRYAVRLAASDEDRAGAQRLRYKVFVEEMGAAATAEERAARREWDDYDAYADHFLLIDRTADGDPLDRVVGAYRLIGEAAAREGRGFYGESEYDLGALKTTGRKVLELGRSCVSREHRGGPAMHLLWNGLAGLVLEQNIEILFGVASFPGADPAPLAEALSYLHQTHLAPEDVRPRALAPNRIEMNLVPPQDIDAKRAMQAVPPLIKAYLRLGGFVGDGAYLDRQFNTIDVCLIMDTARMVAKYRAFYERMREPNS